MIIERREARIYDPKSLLFASTLSSIALNHGHGAFKWGKGGYHVIHNPTPKGESGKVHLGDQSS